MGMVEQQHQAEDQDAALLRIAARDPELRQDEMIARGLTAIRKRVADLLGLGVQRR